MGKSKRIKTNKKKIKRRKSPKVSYLGAGMGMGLPLGAALGVIILDDLILGTSLGLMLGIVSGVIIDLKKMDQINQRNKKRMKKDKDK